MNDITFENYGFTYEFGGRLFSFVVTASSEAEALARVQAMSSATLDGVVRESGLACKDIDAPQ
ncbi:hypothetical protein [Thauera aromatica]|uniref:hypothetical protein n=1 Tax=Thauera aromatica TaxID=59405 RepID=UPI00131C2C0A|nr:hypothetical protein [Thauera aromatica]